MSADIRPFSIDPLGSGEGDALMTAREMINNRLLVIEDDLNELVSRIAQTTSKSAIVKQYVPLSEDAFTGALVYFDTETLVYTPALAKLRGMPGAQGQSIEADCARVEGIVLSKYEDNANNVVGTILVGGCWQDDNNTGCPVLTGALGTYAAIPGTYYLSGLVAGKATNDPGIHLRQPIISNHGNGSFSLNIFYMAHDNHFHGSRLLSNNWIYVDTAMPDGVTTPPEGARFWYDGSADPYYIGMGELAKATTVVFYNGLLDYNENNFVVENGYLWFKGLAAPLTDTVTIFNHYPFAYGSPVLRSVESVNDALTVTTNNGRIMLQANDFVGGSISNNAVAVSSIAGKTVQFTPVVSGLAAGPGIKLETAVDGVTTVSTADNIDVPLDAYSIFHKGTNIVCDDSYIYVAFPAGRLSSFVMNIPVRKSTDDITLRAYAYCCGVGMGASFTVQFFWTPQPTANNPTVLNRSSIGESSLSFSGGQDTSVTYAETSSPVEITGAGQLLARVSINNAPTQDVRFISMGFRLEVANAAVSRSNVTNVTNINAIINTLPAGEIMTQYKCVKVVDGELKVCTSTNIMDVNTCVGIAIDSGIRGLDIRYLIQGIVENNSFSFTPGLPIFIGTDGSLTQVDPSTDDSPVYIQRIGMALTPYIVQISIESGIIKEN